MARFLFRNNETLCASRLETGHPQQGNPSSQERPKCNRCVKTQSPPFTPELLSLFPFNGGLYSTPKATPQSSKKPLLGEALARVSWMNRPPFFTHCRAAFVACFATRNMNQRHALDNMKSPASMNKAKPQEAPYAPI